MTCRDVESAGITYQVCPDDPPRAADRLRAIVRWVARDEITQQAPDIDFAITASHPALLSRVARDGVMGVIGNPGRLFPGLDTTSVAFDLTLSAPGYSKRRLQASLGPIAGFPAVFAAQDLGDVSLHREASVLRGRVVRRTGLVPTPLSGVSVSFAGVWSTFPPHDVDPDTVIEPANLIGLSPGLYADRLSGTGSLRRRGMLLVVGEEKLLVAPAVSGSTTVRLSDCVKLSTGDVLAFEPPGERREYIVITAIDPASTDDQPASVTLQHPLALDHVEGTFAVRAVPQPSGPNRTLTRDGIPGDRVAFLGSIAGIATNAVVEINGGAPTEYQTAARYETVSGVDAYYRLPPISRLAAIRLHAERFDLPAPVEIVVSPDYRRYEQRFDLIFP